MQRSNLNISHSHNGSAPRKSRSLTFLQVLFSLTPELLQSGTQCTWYDLVDHDDSSFSFPVPMPRRHSLSEPVLEQEGTSYKPPPPSYRPHLTACKTRNTSDYKFPPPPDISSPLAFLFLNYDLLSSLIRIFFNYRIVKYIFAELISYILLKQARPGWKRPPA